MDRKLNDPGPEMNYGPEMNPGPEVERYSFGVPLICFGTIG